MSSKRTEIVSASRVRSWLTALAAPDQNFADEGNSVQDADGYFPEWRAKYSPAEQSMSLVVASRLHKIRAMLRHSRSAVTLFSASFALNSVAGMKPAQTAVWARTRAVRGWPVSSPTSPRILGAAISVSFTFPNLEPL